MRLSFCHQSCCKCMRTSHRVGDIPGLLQPCFPNLEPKSKRNSKSSRSFPKMAIRLWSRWGPNSHVESIRTLNQKLIASKHGFGSRTARMNVHFSIEACFARSQAATILIRTGLRERPVRNMLKQEISIALRKFVQLATRTTCARPGMLNGDLLFACTRSALPSLVVGLVDQSGTSV